MIPCVSVHRNLACLRHVLGKNNDCSLLCFSNELLESSCLSFAVKSGLTLSKYATIMLQIYNCSSCIFNIKGHANSCGILAILS